MSNIYRDSIRQVCFKTNRSIFGLTGWKNRPATIVIRVLVSLRLEFWLFWTYICVYIHTNLINRPAISAVSSYFHSLIFYCYPFQFQELLVTRMLPGRVRMTKLLHAYNIPALTYLHACIQTYQLRLQHLHAQQPTIDPTNNTTLKPTNLPHTPYEHVIVRCVRDCHYSNIVRCE